MHRPLYQVSKLRIQLQSCQSPLCPEFDQPRLCCVAHSPHIKTITERIMIDGAQISETDFAGLAAHDSSVMQQALQGAFGALSHFEVLTSLAFKHFQRKQVLESTASRLCQQHYVCVCVFSTTLHFHHCKSAKSMLSLTSCLALCKANACTLHSSSIAGDQSLKVTESSCRAQAHGLCTLSKWPHSLLHQSL